MPNTIGTQITSERMGRPWSMLLVYPQVPEPQLKQQEPAEDRRECVVVDVAGLHPAGEPGEPADEPRGAVHHDAVDDRLVAPRPERGADAAHAAREEPVVEVVEAVLALEDGGDDAGSGPHHPRQVGPRDIQVPGSRDAGDRQ